VLTSCHHSNLLLLFYFCCCCLLSRHHRILLILTHTFVCYCFDIFPSYFFMLNSFVYCCPFHLYTLFACVIIIFRFFFYIVFSCMRVVMFCYCLVFICKTSIERKKRKRNTKYMIKHQKLKLYFYFILQTNSREDKEIIFYRNLITPKTIINQVAPF